MKRRMSWALLAGGIALAASAVTAAPATAATSGSQTFKGTIVTSGVSGTRTVITSVVIAKGAFSGVGRIVEVEVHARHARAGRGDLVEQRSTAARHDDAIAAIMQGLGERAWVLSMADVGQGGVDQGAVVQVGVQVHWSACRDLEQARLAQAFVQAVKPGQESLAKGGLELA